MSQIWIKSKERWLSAISNGKGGRKDTCVLAFSGFSQAKCDSYYFMTYLLKMLASNNYYGVSVDLTGHGDSYGDIKDVNILVMEQDIIETINFMRANSINNVYAVGRGLSGNIIAKLVHNNVLDAGIAINPVLLCKEYVNLMNNGNYEIEDTSDFYVCTSRLLHTYKSLFKLLGTESSNIEGETLSRKLFLDLFSNDEIINNVCKETKKYKALITVDYEQYYTENKVDIEKSILVDCKFSEFNDRNFITENIIRFFNELV